MEKLSQIKQELRQYEMFDKITLMRESKGASSEMLSELLEEMITLKHSLIYLIERILEYESSK